MPVQKKKTYVAVPTAEAVDDEEPCSCLHWYLMGGRLSESQRAALAAKQPTEDTSAAASTNTTTTTNTGTAVLANADPHTIVLRLHSESIRQISYMFFWAMVILAIVLSKTMIPPDVIENSDLKDVFGYNNICVYWDYTPSRELTALFYPLFEYSFLLYVILDYIQFRLSVQHSSLFYLRLGQVTFPIKVLLVAWFRMIFVYQVNMAQPDYPPEYGPYIPGALGHTLGFFGLQLALVLVAAENVLFINYTGVEYPYLGKWGTKIGSWLYLGTMAPLTLFKIYVAYTALIGHKIDGFMTIGRVVDLLWMVLVAFMPILFAQVGRKTESHLKITFERDSIAWKDKGP